MELALEKPTFPENRFENTDFQSRQVADEFEEQRGAVEEALTNLGLLKNEVKVYLYLACNGPLKARDIGRAIALHRTEIYRLLRHLEKRGLIYFSVEKPVQFSALPLEKAIDLLVETQRIKIDRLEKEKNSLIKLWTAIPQRRTQAAKKELFQKLEGQQQILLKANELLEKTQRRIQLFAPDSYLAEFYYGGFTDKLKSKQTELEVSLLMENSQKGMYFAEQMQWPTRQRRFVEAHNLPCFLISDEKELLVAFYESEKIDDSGYRKKLKNAAIWTNNEAVVQTFILLCSKMQAPKQHSL